MFLFKSDIKYSYPFSNLTLERNLMVHICTCVVLNVVSKNRLEMFSYRLTYHLVYG